MQNKELLKKLGIETIYSAKGHFKSCDIRRNLITITIWMCAIVNIIGIFDFGHIVGKIISAVGLFGTIALLIWNEGEGKNYKVRHKQVGEEYLALHKEIRRCFFSDACSDDEIKKLNDAVVKIDKSDKLDIPWIARKWAQKAIEKYDETDNWFL